MKSYLITLVATIIAALVVMTLLAGTGIYACLKCDVLQFQESKIATLTPDVETVILGDSSIGFGLDAKVFSELSHEKTVNLALTGYNYGIVGAYILLTEVMSRARPKNVVIALSAQTLSVSMSRIGWDPIRGLIQAARQHPTLLFRINRETSLQVAEQLSLELLDKQSLIDGIDFLRGERLAISSDFRKYDYYAPGTDIWHPPEGFTGSLEAYPPPDYDVFFEKVAEVCRSNELNCIFMFGPLMQLVVEHSQPTIQKLAARIERIGIKVISQSPLKIPDESLGNTMNHVRPALRSDYTQKIYDQIAPSLR